MKKLKITKILALGMLIVISLSSVIYCFYLDNKMNVELDKTNNKLEKSFELCKVEHLIQNILYDIEKELISTERTKPKYVAIFIKESYDLAYVFDENKNQYIFHLEDGKSYMPFDTFEYRDMSEVIERYYKMVWKESEFCTPYYLTLSNRDARDAILKAFP